MSYDLAVWEGERPADDESAAAEFQRLWDRYMKSDDDVVPAPRIAAYVAALLAHFPDIDSDAGDDSPWSSSPLIREAQGPLIYFPMVWSSSEETSEWAARLAEEHGLNCFDPQWDQLRTPYAAGGWRFELTSAQGRTLRDPDAEQIRRVLVRLSADRYYAVLTRADGWYVQVGYGEQAGTRAGWYALERRDGGPDQHYRAELSGIDDVVRAFTAFLNGDPTLVQRFPWRPHSV